MKRVLIVFLFAALLAAAMPAVQSAVATPAPTPKPFASAKSVRPHNLVVPEAGPATSAVKVNAAPAANAKPLDSAATTRTPFSEPVERENPPSLADSFSSAVQKVFSAFNPYAPEAPRASNEVSFCELSPASVQLPTIANQTFEVACYGPGMSPGGQVQVDCPELFWATDIPNAYMAPGRSNYSSRLNYYDAPATDGIVTASTLPTPDGQLACSAQVQIIQDAVSCELSPSPANLSGGEQQQFNLTCFDSIGQVTDCPAAEWFTDVPGATLSDDYDNESSTLITGEIHGNGTITARFTEVQGESPGGHAVYARLQSCSAEVTVEHYYADSCEVQPDSADVLVNGQQEFNVSCFNRFGGSIACPTVEWETDVQDSSIAGANLTASFFAGSVDDRGLVTASFETEFGGGAGFGASERECSSYVHVYDPFATASCSVGPSNASVPFNGSQSFDATCFNADEDVVDCPELTWNLISPVLHDSYVDPSQHNSSTTFYAGETKGHGLIEVYWEGATGEGDGPFVSWPPCGIIVTVFDPDEPVACELVPENALVPTWEQQYFGIQCLNGNDSIVPCPQMEWSTNATGSIVDPQFSNNGTTFRAGPIESSGYVKAAKFAASPMEERFECEASVQVFDAQAVESCNLTPSNASIENGGSQQFNATCLNLAGGETACPVFDWGTDVIDSWMNPLQGDESSVFYAGNASGTGFVYADSTDASCNASVEVFEPVTAVSCNTTPQNASVPGNATQAFGVQCFDASSQAVNCPAMNWSTDVPNSWVAPEQHYSSTVFYAGTTPSSGFVYAEYSSFSCQSQVQVTTQADSCALNPLHAETTVNSSQLFEATCYDEFNNLVDCPVMDWGTTVIGGWMSPLQGGESSTLYTGNAVEDGATVTASAGASFNCTSTVDVNPLNASSCALSPSNASVPSDSTQRFNVACFDSLLNPVTCPAVNWSTDVAGSWVDPVQSNDYTDFYAGPSEANGSVFAEHSLFSCNAQVEVTEEEPQPVSCTLTPSIAQVPSAGSQNFTVQCLDSDNQSIACPVMDWGTDVAGSWMNPLQSGYSSVLYAGMITANGSVNASNADFSCTAQVQVVPLEAERCELAPSSSTIPLNSSQRFNASCFDSSNQSVACPVMNWSDDLVESYLQPESSSEYSVLYSGTTAENGSVTSSFSSFSCQASVQVYSDSQPSSCSLSPQQATLQVNGEQLFGAACLDQYAQPVECPALNWSTTAPQSVMDPQQSSFNSTLRAGNQTGEGIVLAEAQSFSCQANASIESTPDRCTLSPTSAQVPVNGSQLFEASCSDAFGNDLECGVLDWFTVVAGAWMAPNQSSFNSTFYAGTVTANGSVNASTADYSCNASVEVVPLEAVSCSLNPENASMQTDSSQRFNASCFDSSNQSVACPVLSWNTTLSGGWMQPWQSSDYSLLYSGNVSENASVTAQYVNGQNFSCTAQVEVTDSPVASSCTLSPNPASVQVNGQQAFQAACLDQFGAATACPSLAWATDVTSGSMNPLNSPNSSTLTAGNTTEQNKTVIAVAPSFSCQATVNVVEEDAPVACVLSPSTAFVPLNGSQAFNVQCLNASNGSVNCPNMSWASNGTNSSMDPQQSNSSSTFNAGNTGEFVEVTATAGFTCSAYATVYDDSAVACSLSPSSISLAFGGQQSVSVSCTDSQGFNTACPNLNWATSVPGASMSPSQSSSSSVFTAGSTAATGQVTATNGFSCSASAEVHSGIEYGGGEDSHDIYYGSGGGSTSNGLGPSQPVATPTPSPTPTRPPRPAVIASPTPAPTAEPTAAPTQEPSPEPSPTPGPATGLVTQATASWLVVIFGLAGSAFAVFRKHLGF